MLQTSCPDPADLAAYNNGALSSETMLGIERHLDEGCPQCDRILLDLDQTPGPVIEVLQHYPPAFLNGKGSMHQPFADGKTNDPGKQGRLLANKFELLAEIGRGGMGIVYRAREIKLNRIVAIKMISGMGGADADLRARFAQEAKSLAGLEHPNIVHLYEYGEEDGQPYVVLEFVEGEELEQMLQKHPLDPTDAAKHAATLARALQYAHEKGVIHRDLKPANILIGTNGTPKITDFGLAKHLTTISGQTRAEMVMGTANFMPPEQASGRSNEVTAAADIYSLGATLYAMLTGRPPFQGPTFLDVLEQVRTREPVPPSTLQPRVPRDLETICLKCLEKSPQNRYGTSAALADDLDRFLSGRPTLARPVGTWESTRKWVKRHPARFALAAACLLLLIGGPAISMWLWQERKSTLQAEEQGRIQKYFRNISVADRKWLTGEWSHSEEFLQDCFPALRSWEWHHMKRRMTSELPILRGHDNDVNSAIWTADGKMLVTAGDDSTIRLWDASTGRAIAVLQGHEGGIGAIVLGSGSCLYSGGDDGTVRAWDISTGKEVRRLGQLPDSVASLAYCPEQQLLAASSTLLSVTLWDAVTGKEKFSWGPEGLKKGCCVCSLAFSPDGRHLAIAGSDPTEAVIRVWTVSDKRAVFVQKIPRRALRGVAFSPDGQTLAVISNPRDDRTPFSSEVALFDWAANHRLQALRGHIGGITALQYSPSGQHVATTGLDRSVRIWDSKTADQTLILHTPSAASGLAFSPDASSLAIACQDGLVRILNAKTEQAVASYPRTIMANCVAYSLNANQLASTFADGTFAVRDMDSGQEIFTARHDGPWRGTLNISFNIDDDRLVSTAKDEKVRIWSIRAKQEVLTLPHARANCAVFSPDGQMIASAGDDGKVKLWNARTGQEVLQFHGHTASIFTLAFRPDGLSLASGSMDKTVRLWNLKTGKEKLIFRDHPTEVPCVAFSPDGKYIASASDRVVTVRDATTGEERKILLGHALKVTSLAWNSDGKRLATASDDRTVKIWDPVLGIEVLTLTGHRGGVTSLAFDHTGELLTSASWDGTSKVWDGRPFAK